MIAEGDGYPCKKCKYDGDCERGFGERNTSSTADLRLSNLNFLANGKRYGKMEKVSQA